MVVQPCSPCDGEMGGGYRRILNVYGPISNRPVKQSSKQWQRISENKHLRLYSDLVCASSCAQTGTLPTLTHMFTNALKNAVLFFLSSE